MGHGLKVFMETVFYGDQRRIDSLGCDRLLEAFYAKRSKLSDPR
jgi:hypothetical protein